MEKRFPRPFSHFLLSLLPASRPVLHRRKPITLPERFGENLRVLIPTAARNRRNGRITVHQVLFGT